MDLSMIQELSDKLTRFELSFQSTRAKSCVRLVVEMFYYAVKWDCSSDSKVHWCQSWGVSVCSRQGCCVFWGRQVGIPAVSLLLSSCSWEFTVTNSAAREGSSQGWFFVSCVFHLEQCQLRARQGRVIKCHDISWFSGVLPLAGSFCSVTEGRRDVLAESTWRGRASKGVLKPKLLFWVCRRPETRGGLVWGTFCSKFVRFQHLASRLVVRHVGPWRNSLDLPWNFIQTNVSAEWFQWTVTLTEKLSLLRGLLTKPCALDVFPCLELCRLISV